MKLYRVEVWDDGENDFVVYSRHRNQDHAVIMAEVKGQTCKSVRVINEGRIIFTQDMPRDASKHALI
jgi:hypothetical protein